MRTAINLANGNPGEDRIFFNLSAVATTITPVANMPAITEAVTLDGTTQPGYDPANPPLVKLQGSVASGVGLDLQNIGSQVTGLQVIGFSDDGIRVGPELPPTVANHVIGPSNVISGNNGNGILITRAPFDFATNGNKILGNKLGLSTSGGGFGQHCTWCYG